MPTIQAGYRLRAGHFREGAQYGTLRPRGTGDWLLIHTVAGRGRIGLADGTHRLVGPGEAILYRPGAFQDYSTDRRTGRWELLWAHFIPADAWLDLLEWPEVGPGLLHLQVADRDREARLRAALTTMVEDYKAGQAMADRLAANALERALLGYGRTLQESGAAHGDARVRACLDVLTRRLAEPVSVAALARQVGLSASRLAHLFQAHLGVSPMRWRDQRRIQVACGLLETTDHTVQAVGRAVGYVQPAHFANRFRQLTGQTPQTWRARVRTGKAKTPYDR